MRELTEDKIKTLHHCRQKVNLRLQRSTFGSVKFSKNGLRLSPTLLANYGFSQGDEFKVSCMEEGKIVLEKKN